MLLLLAGLNAWAADVVEPTEAQFKLYEEGAEAFREGQYRKAIDLFEASLHLGKLNITYLNLGRAYFKLGSCVDAAQAYDLALQAPQVSSPSAAQVLEKIQEYRADLSGCPGQVIVTCVMAPELSSKTEIFVGGQGPFACNGQPVQVKPGKVRVHGSAGAETYEAEVDVAAMEEVVVELGRHGHGVQLRKDRIRRRRRPSARRKKTAGTPPSRATIGLKLATVLTGEATGTASGDLGQEEVQRYLQRTPCWCTSCAACSGVCTAEGPSAWRCCSWQRP